MLALKEYEAGVCECGIHESLTSDTSNHFTFGDRVCPVCRGLKQYGRIKAAEDEGHRKARYGDKTPPPESPDPADGRHTHVRLMSHDEVDELDKKRRGGGS